MEKLKSRQYTIEEYLALEEQALDEKHEYLNGRINVVNGGTINHGLIIGNTYTCLRTGVEQQNLACVPTTSEVRLYIEAYNSFLYPDGMLLCGEIEVSEQDRHAVANPTLIFEVLSRSTEGRDRGKKFRQYCSLVSFREYVLIDSRQPIVDVLYREGPGKWTMTSAIGLDKSIYIHTIDTEVALSDLYRNTIDLGRELD